MSEPFLFNMSELEKSVLAVVEPIVEGQGCELVHLRVVPRSTTSEVEFFIDEAEGNNPIGVKKLEFFNRLLGDALDVFDAEKKVFPGAYNLMVSSPGVERPLRKMSHFKQALTKLISVKTDGVTTPKKFSGILVEVFSEGFKVLIEGSKVPTDLIAWEQVLQAHLVYVFSLGKKKKN